MYGFGPNITTTSVLLTSFTFLYGKVPNVLEIETESFRPNVELDVLDRTLDIKEISNF